jgi:hypothetical protein
MKLEQYPLAGKMLHDYYLGLMLESINVSQLPDDYKEQIKAEGIEMDKIEDIANTNPRHLFDFFDGQAIYVNVEASTEGTFMFSIVGNVAMLGSTKTYNTRKEAESEAIEQAMKQLELSLTNSVIDKKNS